MREDELNRMMLHANDGQLCITLPLANFRKLESDSQMLEDLIEMSNDIGVVIENGIVYTKPTFDDYDRVFGIESETPREAIAAAIKAWKDKT